MTQTEDLYRLEQLDTSIEQDGAALAAAREKLGDRRGLEAAAAKLEAAKLDLAERRAKHRAAEAGVDDITAKIDADEQKLYSGSLFNPKELNSLQREVALEKERRDEMENAALEIIDGVEAAEKAVDEMTAGRAQLEKDWQAEQVRLTAETERLTRTLDTLRKDREKAAARIDKAALDLYERIRKQKKPAVSRVEQGICQSCRIQPPVSSLQRARAGQAATCGCGRILYVS